MLSADIPLPPKAENVQFSETPTQLFFDLADEFETVEAFYREKLTPRGWKATSARLAKVGFYHVLIFRNTAKDLMKVELSSVEGKTRGLVKFQTAAEVAAIEKELVEIAAAKAAAANKPKPKQAIVLPANATNVKTSEKKSNISFQVAIGEAKAAVEAIKKQLIESEWKVEEEMHKDMFGTVNMRKDEQTLSLTYVETGVLAPDISLSAIGMELEVAKPDN